MIRIGLPSGIGALSFALSASVVVKLVAIYGTTVVALFGACQKVLRFGIMVMVGLGLGTSALVGQFLGSRQLDRAWLAAVVNIRLAAWGMLIFGGTLAVAAPWVVRIFFADPALVEPGSLYLRLLAIELPFVGIILGAEQAYAGAGRNTPPLLMHLLVVWGFIVPLMLLGGRALGFGPAGMMAGHSLGQILGAIVAVRLLQSGSWLTHEV
jgi:Na+-driven multidrug efflux pump